jgi:hypothetical protein
MNISVPVASTESGMEIVATNRVKRGASASDARGGRNRGVGITANGIAIKFGEIIFNRRDAVWYPSCCATIRWARGFTDKNTRHCVNSLSTRFVPSGEELPPVRNGQGLSALKQKEMTPEYTSAVEAVINLTREINELEKESAWMSEQHLNIEIKIRGKKKELNQALNHLSEIAEKSRQ